MKKPLTNKERKVIMDLVISATQKLERAYKHFANGRELSESEKRTAKQLWEAALKASDITI